MKSLLPSADEYTLCNVTVPAVLWCVHCRLQHLQPCPGLPCRAHPANTLWLSCALSSPTVADGATDADGLRLVDLVVARGRIEAVRTAGGTPPTGVHADLQRAVVFPCFVDVHTHIGASSAAVAFQHLSLTLRPPQTKVIPVSAAETTTAR